MTEETEGRDLSGQQLVSYRLEAVIGCGLFGCVYRARHAERDTVHAVKVLRPAIAARPYFRDRFMQDMQTAVNLSHPSIVRTSEFGLEGEVAFVASDLIDSRSLGERLAELPLPQRSGDAALHGWIRDIAGALDHAHARGIVHRDLKPSNVLVRARDERAMITDFAIARPLGDRGLASIGTPAYLAPEQRDGDGAVTAAVDVYAFAAMLHEIAAGAPPAPRQPLPGLDAVLDRGLAASPEVRHPTAGELAAEFLAAFAPRDEAAEPEQETASPAPPVPEWVAAMRLEYEPWPPPMPERHRKGRLRWFVVAALGAFVAAGFGAIAVLGLNQPSSPAAPATDTPLAAGPPQATTTPAPTPTPTSPTGLPLPVRGTVGRPVEMPGVRLTVVKVDTGAAVPARLAAASVDSRFVAIEVRYENTGSGPVGVSPFDWNLMDGTGAVYQGLERQASGDLQQQQLGPGRTARGVIGFLVPRSAQRLSLTYTAETGDQIAVVPVT